MLSLSLDNGWTDRNADCCVNTVDEKTYYGYKFGELWSVTSGVLWLICMDGDCREAKIRCALVFKGH